MGLCQLAEKRRASDINAACAKAMGAGANLPSFRTIKHLLEAGGQAPGQIQMELREVDPIIRPLSAYSDFIRSHETCGSDDFHQTESTTLTEPQTTSKAS
jgi:hypothetical protein